MSKKLSNIHPQVKTNTNQVFHLNIQKEGRETLTGYYKKMKNIKYSEYRTYKKIVSYNCKERDHDKCTVELVKMYKKEKCTCICHRLKSYKK